MSGESRNIIHKSEDNDAESISSSDASRPSNSDYWEIAIHSLLVEWIQRGLDGEMHQDRDRDRYTSNEEGTVVDNAADELELIAVSKNPTRLLPHAMFVPTNLERTVQEATPMEKIWCVNLVDDAHALEIISGQLNVMKTYLKAKYNCRIL